MRAQVGFSLLLFAVSAFSLRGQSPEALSQYFEGKPVTVKLDMPGTQRGIDIRAGKPQPLDTKSYAARLKQYGISLHSGDTVIVTKVKVKSDNIEFQLGGGGYGTAGDPTDEAVHFTPADKSSREKDLENQLATATDDSRRRSLLRELEDLRRDRERQDRRNRAAAERDAEARRERIAAGRLQGGSRFNIRIDKRTPAEALTPEFVMQSLGQYVVFPEEGANADAGPPATPVREDVSRPPAAAPVPDPATSLKKGLTRAQVEALLGPPIESHERAEDSLTVTSCSYQSANETVQADFVNGVLVRYKLASR